MVCDSSCICARKIQEIHTHKRMENKLWKDGASQGRNWQHGPPDQRSHPDSGLHFCRKSKHTEIEWLASVLCINLHSELCVLRK